TLLLPTSLFGDVAAALRTHGSATLDEHRRYFRRPSALPVCLATWSDPVRSWVRRLGQPADNPWSGHAAGAIVWMVGRWSKIVAKAGVGLPAGEGRTARDAIDGLLELSRSQESG